MVAMRRRTSRVKEIQIELPTSAMLMRVSRSRSADNRGICAHSGFCTDRISSVFHVDVEPFVTPSGGRIDEIIQAVRACPSGAPSYAIDHVEARTQVDQDREPWIEVSNDGPYRITGGVRVVDKLGNEVSRAQGSSHEHFSLCR